MKHKLTTKQLIPLMVGLSAVLYLIHYLIFRDPHHIAIFFVHDIAFLPLEVLLVSLVFDRLLERSHANENRGKLSMIESVFFSESGCDMLLYLHSCDPRGDELRLRLALNENWRQRDFIAAKSFLKEHSFKLDAARLDFFGLHHHLSTRHSYFLKVIENPALMLHEDFTRLMLDIYLLWEELESRDDLYSLPDADRTHLCALTENIYALLTDEWLDNAQNIQVHQPARLHKIMRTNPFMN